MKVWKKEEIKDLIENRNDAVIRGMLRIYDLQTESEKVFGDTHENNGIGFSGVDVFTTISLVVVVSLECKSAICLDNSDLRISICCSASIIASSCFVSFSS